MKKIEELTQNDIRELITYDPETGKVYWNERDIKWFDKPKNVIDHVNGDPSDNRWCNLRVVQSKENSRNCKISKNNTTGANGIWKNESSWVAEIMVDRKKISLGSFKTLEEAIFARKSADAQYGFSETHGRF